MQQVTNTMTAVSLFSGAAIGDIGFRAAGYIFLAMSEIDAYRANLAQINFPDTEMFVGDINERMGEVTEYVMKKREELETDLFLVLCTAPCQGMSKSGQGTLLRNIRMGRRPILDPRNRLILPALDMIKTVNPLFIVFENVCEMRNTLIEDKEGQIRPILDIIRKTLSDKYQGEAYDVEFADYGIPQRRKRLITVYTRDSNALQYYERGISLIPEATHSKDGVNNTSRWVTVGEVLDRYPSLDAASHEKATDSSIPFHAVPVLDKKKYEWIRHTPPGASAFDNQCVNPDCNFQQNRRHGASRNNQGINQPHKDTPLYCEKCGSLLPRPYTHNKDGSLRIMSGYTSAYKRMDPDLPASALTRNLSFPCSDHKIHPYQNRVLSLAEAFAIHTLSDYEYQWGPYIDSKGKTTLVAPPSLIRLVLGESVPPRFTELLGKHLKALSDPSIHLDIRKNQLRLFYL